MHISGAQTNSNCIAVAKAPHKNDLEFAGAPFLLALRKKMVKNATECGIKEVSNRSVEFMMLALEVIIF